METMRRRRRGTLLGQVVGWTAVLLAVVLGVGAGVVEALLQSVPQPWELPKFQPHQTTRIYAAGGQRIASLYHENRTVVALSQIPKPLIEATIAIEDARFYQHVGVDLRGLVRALWADLAHQSLVQGGSTLTQQLARDIYLTRKKTVMRKFQEALLALRLEREYAKEEILEMYLNQVYYGHGAYGVAAAAEVYFGKPLQDLSLAECALVAGLQRWPSGYSPFRYPQRARARRNLVLRRMAQLGYLTPQEAQSAQAEPLRTVEPQQPGLQGFRAPYFVTYVIQQLLERFGEERVYRGGLRVYTTLHLPLQAVADEALRLGLRQAQARHVTQGAVVCLDPYTGAILALVGGRNFRESQFNRATQALRPAGSAFKPFVYTAAIDSGLGPQDVFDATPTVFYQGETPYKPQNYDPRQVGPYTLERALALSVNVVAVRLIERIGPRKVIEYAHRMGIQQPLPPYLSLALGCCSVTPLEMAAAYIPFVTGGFRAEPRAILRVEDSEGRVLWENPPRCRRVIPARTASTMREMLREVIRQGTGRSADLGIPQGGKTGTTQDDRDAWFIGFTPGLVTAVWVGNDDNRPMHSAWGGNTCTPIWVKINRAAREMFRWPSDFPATDPEASLPQVPSPGASPPHPPSPGAYPPRPPSPGAYPPRPPLRKGGSPSQGPFTPATPGPAAGNSEASLVILCRETGLLATPDCPHTVVRKVPSGGQPLRTCHRHRKGR